MASQAAAEADAIKKECEEALAEAMPAAQNGMATLSELNEAEIDGTWMSFHYEPAISS